MGLVNVLPVVDNHLNYQKPLLHLMQKESGNKGSAEVGNVEWDQVCHSKARSNIGPKWSQKCSCLKQATNMSECRVEVS